jgi:hypothetical protein
MRWEFTGPSGLQFSLHFIQYCLKFRPQSHACHVVMQSMSTSAHSQIWNTAEALTRSYEERTVETISLFNGILSRYLGLTFRVCSGYLAFPIIQM